MKFKRGDRVRCTHDNPGGYYLKGWMGTVRPDGSNSPLINWDNGKSTYCNESFLKLIKEDTMKERVLKDDEVMQEGDVIHYKNGERCTVYGGLVGFSLERLTGSKNLPYGAYLKVTRPGGEKMQERQYPKVIYRMWKYTDDLDMIDSLPPKERETAGEVAIYELKEVVTVTMEPKVRKKK